MKHPNQKPPQAAAVLAFSPADVPLMPQAWGSQTLLQLSACCSLSELLYAEKDLLLPFLASWSFVVGMESALEARLAALWLSLVVLAMDYPGSKLLLGEGTGICCWGWLGAAQSSWARVGWGHAPLCSSRGQVFRGTHTGTTDSHEPQPSRVAGKPGPATWNDSFPASQTVVVFLLVFFSPDLDA